MCGIFGLVVTPSYGCDFGAIESALDRLFLLSETRGKEAAGLALLSPYKLTLHREALPASKMIKSPRYKRFLKSSFSDTNGERLRGASDGIAAIGHARLVTNGLQAIDNNNQPILTDNVVLVHNGIIVNDKDLWQKVDTTAPQTEVDSEVIAALIQEKEKASGSLETAVKETFGLIQGEASVAAILPHRNALLLATNTGSLYVGCTAEDSALFFVSESHIARSFAEKNPLDGFGADRIHNLKAHTCMLIDLQSGKTNEFSLEPDAEIPAPFIDTKLAIQRTVESQWLEDEASRKAMQRCTRCLLPETMPFIEFDHDGVCSYCQNYEHVELKGEDALCEKLDAHRKPNGEADCLVAFSGGRDSSYGLHLLSEEYGVKPIAYTYDWGMVTDIARRNQARMCGALGVEHIWISADIKAKRSNIRRNINAWMKKPDLGMIPLFMAGDKHFFFNANKVVENTGIDLMVFCPNKLEKTEFKTGFCGIPPNSKQHAPHLLDVMRQVKMLTYYGKQYITNPAYINLSLLDTFTAFVSYYYQVSDYLYLFDYLPWIEEEVDSVLIGQYDWETAPDIRTTWRIGDGSAAFYNFVYFTIAGFTEHDTFRSNQIREGHLDRATAEQLVAEENKPRWESIRDYTKVVGVDFDEVIKTVNNMPKLYSRQR